MLNKFCRIIFLLLISFLYYSVKAETFTCEYSFSSDVSGNNIVETYNFLFDNDNGTVDITNKNENRRTLIQTIMYDYTYNFVDGEIKLYKVGECPTLYIAEHLSTADYSQVYYYNIYSDAYLRDLDTDDQCVKTKDILSCISNAILAEHDFYYYGHLTSSEINKDNKEISVCPGYSILSGDLNEIYDEYENCSNDSCKRILLMQSNEKIKKIYDYCRTSLSYRNISLGTGTGEIIYDECVRICLDIDEKIDEIKMEHNIKLDKNNGACGFSSKLITYIANIVRWLKYIIPVIVIGLGILDFIKAMSQDKEDEMKKAQKRFVIRLISAALIFILPFILEFILNKMGFASNGCGIIDL